VGDRVRVRTLDRDGDVNDIEPNEHGNGWLFEVVFGVRRHDYVMCTADELELIEASGQEHDPEIELALDVERADADIVADRMQRLVAEAFALERVRRIDADDLRIGIAPRDHPRDAVRALMERLGSAWLVEDDGWYANVTWAADGFPVAGVEGAQIFLRPWRSPRGGERLPGECIDPAVEPE
jgi:hypothetical protein